MSVSKMKTVIILILVLMNLFLLMLVVPNFMPRYHQAQQAQTQLQTLFESYQLSLDLSTLPKSQPITSVNVSYDSDAALTAAKALLGDTVLVEEDPALYYSSYTSSSGTLRVYRSGLCDAALTGFDAVSDPAEHAQKLLTRMGLDICAITAQDTGTGAVAVTATQSLGGIPLDPAQIQLVYTDGCLTQLSGTLYLGTLSRPSSQTCLDCGEALIAFLGSRDVLGWVADQVYAVEQCYTHAGTASAATVRLDPSWKITTDTGYYLVNGITGAVTTGTA